MGIRDLLIERLLLRRIVSLGRRGPALQDLPFSQVAMAFRMSRGMVPSLAGWLSVPTILAWGWYVLGAPAIGLLEFNVNRYALTTVSFGIAIVSTMLDFLSRVLLRIRIGLHLIGKTPCAQCGYPTTELIQDGRCPECGRLLATQSRLLRAGILEVFAWPWLARFDNDHAPRAAVRIGRQFSTSRVRRAMALRLLAVLLAVAVALVAAKFLTESVPWMQDFEPSPASGGLLLIAFGIAGLVYIETRPKRLAMRVARRVVHRAAMSARPLISSAPG